MKSEHYASAYTKYCHRRLKDKGNRDIFMYDRRREPEKTASPLRTPANDASLLSGSSYKINMVPLHEKEVQT